MKESINRLPKRTQQELTILVELITKSMKNCEMIILFGSYARGEHCFWDERFDFGTHTTFQSDLDILIVLSNGRTSVPEQRLSESVIPKYNKILENLRPTRAGSNVIRYAPPQFVLESIQKVNKELEKSQYFFTDIVKEGILLYDTENCTLAKAQKLSYKDIKQIAEEEYEIKMKRGNIFLDIGYYVFNKEYYVDGSFQLHQACERYYQAISLVFTNYQPKQHDLKKLLGRVKSYSRDLISVFPETTPFEKRCYKLLCLAYIEARYNKDFVVTKQEYEYMLERIELLKSITERICLEKIASYDALIVQEEV